MRAALALALSLLAAPVAAQELAENVTDRCVRAAVKITVLADGGGGSTGSGTIIDPRGYVLTNFHVVGHMRPSDEGVPGTLLNSANRIQLATVESARQSARPRWRGVVVRADQRLDMALIRIVSDSDGNAIRGRPFTAVPLASTESLRPGSHVWAFGYPLGVRTINVTDGSVAGFQMNGQDEVAWLRTDTEFNPGNSGGMLVDRRGRLVALPTRVYHGRALEPVELARPVERMPAEWRRALQAGHITDTRIDGVRMLTAGAELRDVALGDSVEMARPVDQHFWRPAAGLPRPVRVSLDGRHPIAVMRGDQVLREGFGAVELQPDDGPSAVISILLVNARDNPIRYSVSLEPLAAEEPTTPAETPELAPEPSGEEPSGATVVGRMVQVTNGEALSGGWVFVARPGVQPVESLEAWLRGELTREQLQERFVTAARSNVRGEYVLEGIPPGRYDGAAAADGYRPTPISFTVAAEQPRIELRPIQMRQ
ncbi:MAG: trypsin-like peptidase domain-containing protein [Deltaproteobacteria bacterium]|nr:trypsin-like peptidase domain-containing protein [Deltaproteobacteria bacterium]